jgi:hypothetical protein
VPEQKATTIQRRFKSRTILDLARNQGRTLGNSSAFKGKKGQRKKKN